MAKKPVAKKRRPWVRFDRDHKTNTIMLSRRDQDSKCLRLQFPRVGRGGKGEARLLFEGEDEQSEDSGVFLDYSDVQWLAQALPELLNEMERAGVEN